MKGLWIISALVAAGAVAAAGPPQSGREEFFESRIRPVLAHECYECHSAEGKKKGGLVLDSRAGWQAGGESGVAIIPGNARESLLMRTIRHEHDDLRMPKEGAKLSDKVIADFEKWIKEGAYDPRDKPASKAELAQAADWRTILERRKQEWWCFQPVRKVQPPPRGKHPVDAFLEARLEEHGLTAAPDADAGTVLRRLHFVVTGLPPSPEDSAAFTLRDLPAVVDRLLASPRYGERWARHWLDWVRYAETYGSEGDPAIPYAWRYRDYVIRAFNDDVPYPQMVREAIAGDLLSGPRIKDGVNESALGIGQLRMVLHGFSPVDSLDEMVTFTDNQIDTVTKAFQAMTVTCARCHNHKFDAISQTDFYALYGIFTSTHPAVIDVGVVDDRGIRDNLRELKRRIREAMAKAWLAVLPEGGEAPQSVAPARTGAKWFAAGRGVSAEPTPAGEFAIAAGGDRIIERIHPRGWFSGLLSTKDSAVLVGPRFKCEGGTLWMRTAGAGGSRARYIVENYPRTGTIHKAKDFKDPADAVLGWRQLDLEYWKGDEIFIQCSTAADMPAEAKPDERSWFGITEWRITAKETPPLENPGPGGDPRAAVAAWMAGTATDAQAELLDSLARSGKLPNETTRIPEVAGLVAEYRALEGSLPAPVRSPGVMEADATDRPLFVRGDHKQPAEIVPRRFLEAIDAAPYRSKDSGRLQLAESLADMKGNPLTARVIVNRIWHHVFGRGIVSSADNFGRLGELPTHPDLLDYLAQRFVDNGGSIKEMIRLMVTSRAFQRGGDAPTGAREKDPDNRWLSHWTVRRLEAEAIRDSILQLTGSLDPRMGGASVGGGELRRSVYVNVIRNNLDDFLTAFDAPVPGSARGRRDVTNVPAQSLTLLNDPRIQDWATQWARRVMAVNGAEARVRRMFEEAFGRNPTSVESAGSVAFVKATAETVREQRAALAGIEGRIGALRAEMETLLGPARERLMRRVAGVAVPDGSVIPKAYAEWDFEDGGKDLKGRLHLTMHGNARIEDGTLVLDGGKSFARSVPLAKTLAAKTLEAWVMLDDLDQRGGGVITVQDRRGDVFDSIVFAEKQARCWVPGSNYFKRSKLLDGPPEDEAAARAVHMAMVYEADGMVTAYRDGIPYGMSYRSDGPAVFVAGESEVQFGCRHGNGGGNRMLKGRILRARLHDRALTAVEISASRQLERGGVSEREVLESLAAAEREETKARQARLASLSEEAERLRTQVQSLGGEEQGWASLALSLINAKEFIYLK